MGGIACAGCPSASDSACANFFVDGASPYRPIATESRCRRGTAEVTIGEATRVVHENESTYVPIGGMHRLANPGKIPLELIEVQVGSFLGEDDIVRFSDDYGRK